MLETLTRVRGEIADCADSAAWALSDADAVACLDAVHEIEQAVAAIKLHLVRQVDSRDLPGAQLARSTGSWLRTRLRVRPGTTKRLVTLAAAVDDRPDLDRALIAGAVNVEQAEVIVTCLTALRDEVSIEIVDKAEAFLIDKAAEFDPPGLALLAEHILTHVAPEIAEEAEAKALAAQERRAFAARHLNLFSQGDGRVRVSGILDREAAAIVSAALDPLCNPSRAARTWRDVIDDLDSDPITMDQRSYEQRRADAFVEVCKLALNTGDLPENGGHRPQITVTVSYEQLRDQVGAASLDTGERLTATAVRRLACDAQILPAVLGGEGQVFDVGRTRRLVTGSLRSALTLRDRGCAFPSCERQPRWTDGHHIQSWLDGGSTSLNNSVLLCGPHHRLIHTSDWQVRLGSDGFPDFIPPEHVDLKQRPRRNIFHRRT